MEGEKTGRRDGGGGLRSAIAFKPDYEPMEI